MNTIRPLTPTGTPHAAQNPLCFDRIYVLLNYSHCGQAEHKAAAALGLTSTNVLLLHEHLAVWTSAAGLLLAVLVLENDE